MIPPKLITGHARRTPELTSKFEAEYDTAVQRFAHLLRQSKAEYVDARYKLLEAYYDPRR